ncbi:hypothetical protein SAMN05216436_111138 [bacterium A37T11]|nr:hypothetical protein SAMN05216436_111138 [bacterium A37T11]
MPPFIKGLLLGTIAPVLAYVLTSIFRAHLSKPFVLYAIAALVNLLMLRYFYQRQQEQPARGVMLLTFIGAMVILFTHFGLWTTT